jgi:KUP system potassium uptake protein
VVNTRVVDYEVIIGLTILALLFISQPFGSSKIAFLFGPIMVVWFAFIAGTFIPAVQHARELRDRLHPWQVWASTTS